MSIFEIAMLFCFGFAWPFSIYKSYKSRSNKGKSLAFLYIVLAGYLAGIMHKIMYSFDPVIVLYIVNGIMVLADIMLYYRNRRLLI
jgi:lipopolysaccharide export LptBFGC system permease protein LptF